MHDVNNSIRDGMNFGTLTIQLKSCLVSVIPKMNTHTQNG